MKTLDVNALDGLIAALHGRGYTVVGPTVRDEVVVYEPISSTADLPAGWYDVQDGGSYRLEQRGDGALFGHTVGPSSWKRYLFPPRLQLFRTVRDGDEVRFETEAHDTPRYALFGVRPCELAALAVQDRVFTGDRYVDPVYAERRREAFVVAVQCGRAGGTCFCASMGTGPRADSGFDLALTELLDDGRHVFVVEAGSERGEEVLAQLDADGVVDATDDDRAAAERASERAAGQMGRRLDTDGLKERLLQSYEDPRWQEVAERCLACANCTMVCPTCFCSTVEDTTDLAPPGEAAGAERWRRWDSCFHADFTLLGGGAVRGSVASRYRQWLLHKLATWHDQFGTSGCVGCGRCITWCPVGIDITEEARVLGAGRTAEPVEDAS